MKLEFHSKPESFQEQWPGEFTSFSWQDFLTCIPSPLFLVTSYKDNGKANACLQSWSTFLGENGEFICLMGGVNKNGHLYRTLRDTGCCVLNFPSRDVFDRCAATIEHNGWEEDELAASGLTAEPAVSINAPRVAECFLNIECQLLWERELLQGSDHAVIALKATHIAMDADHSDESRLGRFGKTGYMYNVHSPRTPQTGEVTPDCFGALELHR